LEDLKKNNTGVKIEDPQSNTNTATVFEPQAPEQPQTPLPIFQETNTDRGAVLNPNDNQYEDQIIELKKLPIPNKDELFIGNDPQPLQKTSQPKLMLPAPQPGFIIRYNQERGVYEEVREIKIETIKPVE
jgi:hypothetical protein